MVITVTLHKGTMVYKDVSGGLGQAWLLCRLLRDTTVKITEDWKFKLNNDIYRVFK